MTISWSATSTPSHSFSTATMEHTGLLDTLPKLSQMEAWTYLSSPINCQTANAEETPMCNKGTRDFSYGCCDARDLHNLWPTISVSKRSLRLRHCSGRWKALQKSPGKSWAMQATPVSADMVIKAPAASRFLTLKQQHWECARQFGNCHWSDKTKVS